MAFPEVFTALQQGTVDGQENPLSVIMAAKFDQVQKHLTLTGHVYSPCVFLMNKAAFDKLSTADKSAFLEAAKVAAKANRARVADDDAKGVAELRSKGMSVVENVDKAKFVAALLPVYGEFDKQFGKAEIDKMFKAIVDQFERESTALYSTAHLWDDGIIDPRDTRRVLAFTLSIARESLVRPLNPITFGVARM